MKFEGSESDVNYTSFHISIKCCTFGVVFFVHSAKLVLNFHTTKKFGGKNHTNKKMNENIRFIETLDLLREMGIITDYKEAASLLGTNKSGISDIKHGRKKPSISLLVSLKKLYHPINLDYIIMGEGLPFATEKDTKEFPTDKTSSYYIEHEAPTRVVCQPVAEYQTPNNCPPMGNDNAVSLALIRQIDTMQSTIIAQAEEIGRLKAENEILREENSRYAICEKGGSAIESIAEIA